MKSESFHDLKQRLAEASKIGECYECGVCTANCPLAHMIPSYYNPRTTLLRLFLDPERCVRQIGPWLCMRCRRCSKRCRQKLSPHDLFFRTRTAALESGVIADPSRIMSEALTLLEEKVPLPLVSGWLCLRPDEADGTHSAVGKLAENVLKDFLKEHGNSSEKAKQTGSDVAIVGSGPAGLAAATELAKKGYAVHVLEKASEPGGMLRRCIPNFRLSRDLVDAEIGRLRSLGVDIRTNTYVGRDTSISKLLEDGNRALFIAPGCGAPSKLRIDGESFEGVIYAVEFLEHLNSGGNVELGDSVVVIGGGNVGIDAARAVIRLKPKTVRLTCPESREEMPSDLSDIEKAEQEGVQTQPSCMPRKILGKDRRVSAIEFVKTKPGQYDRDGKFLLVPIEGSEFTVEADTVIVAIGQQANLDFLSKEIRVNRRNTIETDPFSLETSMRGVFAGGDAVLGPASVFEAIYAGWKAAISMDRFLKQASTS